MRKGQTTTDAPSAQFTSHRQTGQMADVADTDQIRRAVTVHGRVQGVSFRWYTAEQANRLGLVGWVRNDAGGTVRLEVQGPEQDVEALVAWVHHGPPAARVTNVDVDAIEPTQRDIDFRITH